MTTTAIHSLVSTDPAQQFVPYTELQHTVRMINDASLTKAGSLQQKGAAAAFPLGKLLED